MCSGKIILSSVLIGTNLALYVKCSKMRLYIYIFLQEAISNSCALRFLQISRNLINPHKRFMSHDMYRLPRSLGLTQPSWWRASASLRLRLVWLVHVNTNLSCLPVTIYLLLCGENFRPICQGLILWHISRLAQSGWQRGRILTSLISLWQELPEGSMAGLTNTSLEMFFFFGFYIVEGSELQNVIFFTQSA